MGFVNMRKITRKHLEKFLEEHKTNELILDIGAGRVETNHSYTQFFPQRYTLDISFDRQPDIVADIHNLPFPDASYNIIVCTEVLEHCHTPQKAIDEMFRVLTKGGKLILTTRFVYPLHDVPHDYFRFTKYGLKYLFKNWSSTEIKSETKSFSAIGALMQRIGFQTSLRGGKFTKIFVYLAAMVLEHCDKLIVSEYGDIRKERSEEDVMTTGYYLVAMK
jgi:SAM-dependent methyltransferase